MNKYQKVVVIIMAANIALMLLFPPFLDNPLRRGALPSFESFYPVLSAYGLRRVHSELLTLEVMFAVINGLIAWLALDRGTGKEDLPESAYTRGIALFAVANIAFVMLFPPFESYPSLLKFEAPSFDGFYFVLGDKRHRHFFIPLLYLEITLVVINALVAWLLFNTLRRGDIVAKEKILELAKALPPEQVAEVTESLRASGAPRPGPEPHLGAGPDRRKGQDPRYRGPERREGGDRRQKTRLV